VPARAEFPRDRFRLINSCGSEHTLRLPAIINLINQLLEPVLHPLADTHVYPQLTLHPEADCKRYEALYTAGKVAA